MSLFPVPKKTRRYQSRSHAHSPNQEARIAKDLNAVPVKGSGCGKMEKGDVRDNKRKLLIEAKATIHKSFSLKRETIEKITDEATAAGLTPVMQVDFLPPEGTIEKPLSVAVVPVWVLELLPDFWNTNDDTDTNGTTEQPDA